MNPPLIVVDTMVVVSGVAGDPAGSSAVLDAASTGQVRLAISDAQLPELVRVFGYPEIEELTRSTVRAFEVGLDIGYMGIMHHPRRLDRPSLADPKDSGIFDLAQAAGADYIVSYDRAVKEAAGDLGFACIPPENLMKVLRQHH